MALKIIIGFGAATFIGMGFAQAQGVESFVSNSSSCTSQGSWTQNALEQANSIANTVNQLQNDENCEELVKSMGNNDFGTSGVDKQSPVAQEANRAEALLKQLESLRTVLKNSPDGAAASELLTPIIARTTLESMTRVQKSYDNEGRINPAYDLFTSRYGKVANEGLNFVNNLFTALPNYKKCMQKRPDAIANILVGGIRMAAAFGAGGQGVNSKYAETVNTLGNFIKNITWFRSQWHFVNITSSITKQKLWSEMSCLIETSQANYCSVKDGFQLIKDQKRHVEKGVKGSPLEGYFVMQREVPDVSNWIQQIQMGIEPRLKSDAQMKKDTWLSIVRAYNDIYDLPATYYENLNTVYNTLSTVEQKQNNIRELIGKLSRIMSDVSSGGETNFFLQTTNALQMPFFLLGRDQIPPEVIATGANRVNPEDYLLDLDRTPELRNPDVVMQQIIVRLRVIMNSALNAGAAYFRKRMSVDQMNLVDEAITGSGVTVRQGFVNIRSYLVTLYGRLKNKRSSQAILPSLLDTISRIDRTLARFKKLDQAAANLKARVDRGEFNIENLENYDGADRAAIQSAFEEIVAQVYLDFNILLQRDAFISTRIGTYVRHDYFSRTNAKEFSQYSSQLFITAGKNILDRMQEYMQFNVAAAEADLSNANVINMENLDQLENLTIDHMEDYLLHLNRRSGRNGASTNKNRLIDVMLFPRIVLFAAKQDVNDEADKIRSKICIQSLGFKRYQRFAFLCRGAKLSSTIQAKNSRFSIPLEMDYNKLFRERFRGDAVGNKILSNATFAARNRFSQVCLLRDYFRNNYVGWMTQNFSEKK